MLIPHICGELATWIGSWAITDSQIKVKMFLVLVVVPLFFDITQFTLQNYWLRNKSKLDGTLDFIRLNSSYDDESHSTGVLYNVMSDSDILYSPSEDDRVLYTLPNDNIKGSAI